MMRFGFTASFRLHCKGRAVRRETGARKTRQNPVTLTPEKY